MLILIEVGALKQKGDITMNRLHSCVVLAIMMTGSLASPAAVEDEKTCWLQAANSYIYVTVWDLDAEGNELVKI